MREIKFRIWNGAKSFCTDDFVKDNLFNFLESDPELVTQFTGLKDKNGKEIYEGDIDSNYDVVAWCEKRNGWSMWTYDHPTKEYISCNCYQCEGNFELSDLTVGQSEIEIIGNIYENLGLL